MTWYAPSRMSEKYLGIRAQSSSTSRPSSLHAMTGVLWILNTQQVCQTDTVKSRARNERRSLLFACMCLYRVMHHRSKYYGFVPALTGVSLQAIHRHNQSVLHRFQLYGDKGLLNLWRWLHLRWQLLELLFRC